MAIYQPIITKFTMVFDLHTPIYGSFYGIWDKWLKIARKRNLAIVVNTKFGKSSFTYNSYMKGAKRLERYYKNPDEPMVFWGREFLADILERDKRKKFEQRHREITQEIPFDVRLKLSECWKKIKRVK